MIVTTVALLLAWAFLDLRINLVRGGPLTSALSLDGVPGAVFLSRRTYLVRRNRRVHAKGPPFGVSMASELESIRAWFSYLENTRKGYIESLAKLPSAELTRDRGASYPSLLDVFAHSQGALYFWMKSIAKFEFPPQVGDPDAPPSIEVLRKDEEYVQTQIQRVMTDLTEPDLSRTIFKEKGKGWSHDCYIPIREALWHLVEEELQHRGEINALLWQIDVEAPVYDWIEWDHEVGRIQDPRSK